MNGTPSSKRTRQILCRLPPGYRLEKVGRRSHLAVIRPDGEQLRGPDGMPIYVTGTARDGGQFDLARIRRAIRGA